MSAAAKKLPAAPRDTASSSPSSARNTPRTSTSSPTAAQATSPSRTRSIRTGAPVSARAAAQQRRDSPLSSVTHTADGGNGGADALEREESLRAENLAVLDDLKARLERAETASQQYQRQAEVLQSRLDEALKEQASLEEKIHESEESLEALQNERRDAVRQIREMENIYEAERSAMNKEKEEMANREEEMQTVIQRLKDSLAQRNGTANDDELRPSRHSNNASPSLDSGSGFAPPASLQRSDSRNNSKLIMQKDKLIESLRLELAEAQIKLVESENQGGGRMQEVERLLMEARMANARLMEDNESYQLLLQERTLNGDFSKTDFSYMASGGSGGGATSNQDALNALEGRSGSQSLADELSEAGEAESENYRRLEAELKSQKDQNKALTLYINKIIERLLQHQDFEHILDQSDTKPANTNKELPPPPAGQIAAAGASLLARAKSIAIKPRPMSFMPSATREASNTTAHNNPETAPSIPIGLTRSASTRRTRPMSEQFTGAAGVVNAMYKGPEGNGPLSPPLRSNTAGFGIAGTRTASGPGPVTSGNFPGETESTTSGDSTGGVSTPPSQSPPRNKGDKEHEKSSTMFAGNKPRPLRLVQENPDAAAANAAANKRSSWMGWFGAKPEGAAGGAGGMGESIRE